MTIGSTHKKVLTVDTMNPLIRTVEYAVRGRLAIRAEEIRDQLREGKKFPFDTVVNCNIGNPQQLNQKPITFFRQVASLCENPDLIQEPLVAQIYPPDVIERAKKMLAKVGSSIGAYSHSQGVPGIRETVAQFMLERDGHPADPNSIYLTQGASAGVQSILSILTQNEKSGILIPIPQYPLYSATLALLGATPVPYYLDEESGWSLDVDQLRKTVHEARASGTDVRALAIINPGNPTGQCLDAANMRDVLTLCYEERLVLLADEVYQTNIYEPEQRPFVSFKKALMDHPDEALRSNLELVSFHSISKGMIGECGRRGGYFECCNLDPDVMQQIYKMASVSLCPNLHGQIMVDLMVNPPRPGDASYESYRTELEGLYQSLRRRSKKLEAAFNAMEGVTCQPAFGSMYLFPRIRLPNKAIAKAKEVGMAPDAYYAEEMLEATGVCVIPGSGFGQEDGTWHFRSTFLPPEDLFDGFCANLTQFHSEFLAKFRD